LVHSFITVVHLNSQHPLAALVEDIEIMFSKAAQVFLASTLLSHAAALVLKPTDPSNLVDVKINAGEKRSAPDTIQLKPIHDPADLIAGHPRRRAAEGDQVFDPSNIHSFYWAEERKSIDSTCKMAWLMVKRSDGRCLCRQFHHGSPS
jgi:hypothetical protein